MAPILFITGNQYKADRLAMWLGHPVKHQAIDLDELQSLDPREVVTHKVRQAYAAAKQPVLVEDVALSFTALGRLPGTFIKWFIGEIGNEGLCQLADGLVSRDARVTITYALYDGAGIHYFTGIGSGRIANAPRGHRGHGWDTIFIPRHSTKTLGEMSDEERLPHDARWQAIQQLRTFLEQGGAGA